MVTRHSQPPRALPICLTTLTPENIKLHPQRKLFSDFLGIHLQCFLSCNHLFSLSSFGQFCFLYLCILLSWKPSLWFRQITPSYILVASTYYSGTFPFRCFIVWVFPVSPIIPWDPWHRDYTDLCSLLHLHHLAQHLAHRKSSMNIRWVNDQNSFVRLSPESN